MDRELADEAQRRGISKAALIRLVLEQRPLDGGEDPIDAVIGTGDAEPVEDIDVVLYGHPRA